MFGKKCKRCGKKIGKDYDFCPYCGFNNSNFETQEDYGLLGRNDNLNDLGIKMPFGFNKLFSTLLNQIDKQFRELDKEIGKDTNKERKINPPRINNKGISINISTASGKKPEIKIKGFGPGFGNIQNNTVIKEAKPKAVKPKNIITDEQAKKISKLPREEASTQVRRLSNKLIYEIALPGVKKIKDVIINQLENSIEIKAFSKDKVYVKLLPVSLPITDYKLEKESLILELAEK